MGEDLPSLTVRGGLITVLTLKTKEKAVCEGWERDRNGGRAGGKTGNIMAQTPNWAYMSQYIEK